MSSGGPIWTSGRQGRAERSYVGRTRRHPPGRQHPALRNAAACKSRPAPGGAPPIRSRGPCAAPTKPAAFCSDAAQSIFDVGRSGSLGQAVLCENRARGRSDPYSVALRLGGASIQHARRTAPTRCRQDTRHSFRPADIRHPHVAVENSGKVEPLGRSGRRRGAVEENHAPPLIIDEDRRRGRPHRAHGAPTQP